MCTGNLGGGGRGRRGPIYREKEPPFRRKRLESGGGYEFLGPAFGRTDFSRIFIFEPPDFSADFLAGFFSSLLWEKVPRKILQENFRENPPKFMQQKSSNTFLQIGRGKNLVIFQEICEFRKKKKKKHPFSRSGSRIGLFVVWFADVCWVHANGGIINGGVACVCAKWSIFVHVCAFVRFFMRFCAFFPVKMACRKA